MAISWREKTILLGECKWGKEAVAQAVVTELIEGKTPRLMETLPEGGKGWKVHHAFFARAGFTKAAASLACKHGAQFVDLTRLDRELMPS